MRANRKIDMRCTWTKEQIEEIYQMKLEKKSHLEVAHYFGIKSPSTITRLLQERAERLSCEGVK